MRKLAVIVALAACAPPSSPLVTEQAIVNGSLDTTHQAVVGVFTASTECSGTLVKTDATSHVGIVLTAAHCVSLAPNSVIQGDDYTAPSALSYSVLDYQADPAYAGTAGSPYDFAVVRILGVDATTPTIPLMTTAQDTMGAGTAVVSVGYGRTTLLTQTDTNNTQRHNIARTLAGVSATEIWYSETTGGICTGDSGGPGLVDIGGVEHVGAVHSYITGNCDGTAYSARLSADDTWLQANLSTTAPALTCDLCTQIAFSGNGACAQLQHACLANTDCSNYDMCLGQCSGDATCIGNCQTAHPLSVGPFNALVDCACNIACSTLCRAAGTCGMVPKCGYVTTAAQRSPCTTCRQTSCCAELTTCAANGVCYDCLAKDDAPAACATNAERQALTGCLTAQCASACGFAPPPVDAGTDASAPPPDLSDSGTAPSGCTLAGRHANSAGWPLAVLLVLFATVRGRRRLTAK